MLDDFPVKGATYRILVVDDDQNIANLIKLRLETIGYEILMAYSGFDALQVIEKYGLPHLAIVDINMPGMDGFEFCEKVQQFSDLPVILLTAIDEEETIVRGIRQFAEDYVTKPFRAGELTVRVERVLRRIGDFAYTLDPVTRVDDHLSIDFTHQIAYVRDKIVSLTPTESKILYILMRNAGRIVTSEFLLKRLWPLDEVFEDTLRVHIHRLRQKIEELPAKPRYVVTERGHGYSFPRKK